MPAHVLAPDEGHLVDLGGLGARFMLYFAESASLFSADAPPDLDGLAALAERYGLEMDFASVPRLAAEHGLDVGPPPPDTA